MRRADWCASWCGFWFSLGCLRALHLVEIRDCDAHCQGESPQIRAHLSTQDGQARTHHKTAQQSRDGMMDHDRKTEGGESSQPALDVSRVCLRARSLFGLTGVASSEPAFDVSQVCLRVGGPFDLTGELSLIHI